jgi:hypothetical protein
MILYVALGSREKRVEDSGGHQRDGKEPWRERRELERE